jgi:hypothetical protein
MPLRIAIVASITIAACLVVPLTVNAVSPSGGDRVSESAEEPDPGESVPIIEPAGAAASSDRTGGVQKSTVGAAGAAGYDPQISGMGLAVLIFAGLLPSLLMMLRSSRRRRAGPVDMA